MYGEDLTPQVLCELAEGEGLGLRMGTQLPTTEEKELSGVRTGLWIYPSIYG